jgi:uncharacterized protein (DUF2336 family)
MAEQSLLAEIEGTFASGSTEKQVEILRRVTDLFLAGVNNYSDTQVNLFDDVILRLAERIESKARAELANRLAPIMNAPTTTMRRLARDEAIEVAGPVLTQSNRLTDDDLLAIAEYNSQPRLLAISKRATLSENISDVLVTRGDRDVVLSVTQNEGARFSDSGYGKLVDKSIDDDVLAICVGMRKDIPREHFHALISKASEVVLAKLAASNPAAVLEVREVLAGITGQETTLKPEPDDREAESLLESARRSGKPTDLVVYELAAGGKLEQTIVALAALCHTSSELVGNVLNDRRGDNDFALLLAKAAGLSWSTAKQICILRRGTAGLPQQAIDAAERNFERLQLETAQRVVHFYNERHSAVANFQQLEQHIREKDGGPRLPRFSGAAAAAALR